MTDRRKTIRSLVRAELDEALSSVEAEVREETVERVARLVDAEVNRERRRCEALCSHRAELWEKTAGAGASAPEPSREEARARRNEARYLADLIHSAADLHGETEGSIH